MKGDDPLIIYLNFFPKLFQNNHDRRFTNFHLPNDGVGFKWYHHHQIHF